VQDKASKVGFDWKKKEDAWEKVNEETEELHRAIDRGSAEEMEGEFGDLLFALVNYSRFIDVNPENALRRTVEKFRNRFQYIERTLAEQGKNIHTAGFEEMDDLWNQAKSKYS